MKRSLKAAALLWAIALLLTIRPAAKATIIDGLEPAWTDELTDEIWLEKMQDIVDLFRDWSAMNGVTDGKGYCTQDGLPFNLSGGDGCYIGYTSANMRAAGLIDYSVVGGWSCNGFARFALRSLYGRSFWRGDMTEHIYTMSVLSTLSEVREFAQVGDTGDLLCIMGYTDFDGDGRYTDDYWHYMIFIRQTDEGILVLDGNFDHDNAVQIHVVPWEFLMSRTWIYIYTVPDKIHDAVLAPALELVDPAQAAGSGRRSARAR